MKRSETLHTETSVDKQIRDFLLCDIHPETDQRPHNLGNIHINRPRHTPRKTDSHTGIQQQTDQRPYILGNIPPNISETSHLGYTPTKSSDTLYHGIHMSKEIRDILENSHYATPPQKNPTDQRPHSLGYTNTKISESLTYTHILDIYTSRVLVYVSSYILRHI